MRKVSPRTAWYAFWGVGLALVLGACIQPNSLEAFLNDDDFLEIVTGGPEVDPPPPVTGNASGTIGYTGPTAPPLTIGFGGSGDNPNTSLPPSTGLDDDPLYLISAQPIVLTIGASALKSGDTIKWFVDNDPTADEPTLITHVVGQTELSGAPATGQILTIYRASPLFAQRDALYDITVSVSRGDGSEADPYETLNRDEPFCIKVP